MTGRKEPLRSVWATRFATFALIAAAAGCNGASSGGKPANVQSLLAAGLAAQQQGNNDAAKQLFEQVLDKQPSNYYAHYDLGVIAQHDGDNPTALQHYGRALTANPTYVPALFNEATIYAATDPPLAITTYRMVVKLQPHAPTAYLNLGLLEAKAGQLAAAVRDLRTAIEQDPSLAGNVPAALKKKLAAKPNAAHSSPTPSASG